MTARRQITAAQARKLCLMQAAEQGRPILCGCGCGEPLDEAEGVIREHEHALGLSGADVWHETRFWRKPCSAVKTNGTAATTAGSDMNRIAKMKRLRGETGQNRRKRKIQSVPFPKRHRPLRGNK